MAGLVGVCLFTASGGYFGDHPPPDNPPIDKQRSVKYIVAHTNQRLHGPICGFPVPEANNDEQLPDERVQCRGNRSRSPGMSQPLRVLMLDDSEAGADLVRAALSQAGMPLQLERVSTKDGFVRALREFAPQVVLADHAFGEFDAAAALKAVQQLRPATPLILVTEAFDEAATMSCLRAGAEDVVTMRNLARLAPAIESALSVRSPLEKLSPRQLEVLRLVSEGHTTRQIALHLKLSVKTVETHRGEVMKRLGLHDVVSLVRYAIRVGLVPTGFTKAP